MMMMMLLLLLIILIISNTIIANNTNKCDNNDDILPSTYRVNGNDINGHIHLILLVNDNQISSLLNFIAITISLQYLPTHRLMFHFICNGISSKRFIEKILHHDCINIDHLIKYKHEYHNIIFKLIDKMNDNDDYATILFDLDTIWIRNMIALYDYLGTKSNIINNNGYDIISVGSSNNHYNNYITFSYTGIFFKNTQAIKKLAKLIVKNLDSGQYDGKDMLNELFYSTNNQFCSNITQIPLTSTSSLTSSLTSSTTTTTAAASSSSIGDKKTILHKGTHGQFQCNENIAGSYINLPLSYTPYNDNDVICKSNILFYHRKVDKCDNTDYLTMNCSDSINHEWILKDHFSHKALLSSNTFPVAPHKHKISSNDNVFDSNLQKHLVQIIQTYVDKDKLLKFCETYTMICKRKITVEKIHDLPLDSIELLE